MKSTQTCECGAVYERTELKLPVRDKDSEQCSNCGRELASWNSSRIPVFRLISTPEAGDGAA